MSLEAGTVTTDLFLASNVASREGWAGGLRGEETGDKGVGVDGELMVGEGAGPL